ncbi:MAG: class I SAM-dependent methyltransferase [Thermodesulfobacteriota bacterium]|nr:class I SAM-dependent methyltransferase [Thermodesulfobacteriota bacterium]
MGGEGIEAKKNDIVERFGPWTAHNIHLGDEIYTMDRRIVGDEIRLKRVVQIISDVACKSISALRVLDLACLEGLFAIELAQQGAEVVAIEGRTANIEKARFAKEVLCLDRLTLHHDDVRNLSVEQYGKFDVVLCLGILYHLTVPDVFSFLESVAEACGAFAIVETEVTPAPERCYVYNGREYWGKMRLEHADGSTAQERAQSLWASLDNLASFCFTRPSLYNVLAHVGFTSVYECHNPRVDKGSGRLTILALKGTGQALRSSPLGRSLPEDNWPERGRIYAGAVKIGRLLPSRMQRLLARLLLG